MGGREKKKERRKESKDFIPVKEGESLHLLFLCLFLDVSHSCLCLFCVRKKMNTTNKKQNEFLH